MNRRQFTQLRNDGSGTLTIPNQALRFRYDTGHVNCGTFWETSKSYGKFYWDALVRPTQANWVGYMISAGYGGNHNLLFGFDSNATHARVTGNIWDGAATKTFQSGYTIPLGDWVHIAAVWDFANLAVYINGVCEGYTAYAATGRSAPSPTDGVLFIGGSDHSKFDMDIAWIRGYEWTIPNIIDGNLFRPFRSERFPRSTFYDSTGIIQSSFLMDFTSPARLIPDLSDGLSNGTRQVITNTVVAGAGITLNGNARNIVTAEGMPNSPKTVTTAVNTTTHTSAALIATAMRTSLTADTDVKTWFEVGGSGADIILTRRFPSPNDSTMNFTIEDVTSAGITEDVSATQTTAGIVGRLIKHPGVREGLVNDLGDAFAPTNANATEAEMPQWVTATFTKPSLTASSVPTNAVTHDHFDRHSVNFWDNSPSLGSTEGGSAGVKSWTNGSSYGSSYSRAYYNGSGQGGATYHDTGITNIDARFLGSGYPVCYVRYQDANNHIVITRVANGSNEDIYVSKVVAGSSTSIGSQAAAGPAGSLLRVTVVGNTCTVYFNGTQIIQGGASLPTGTNVGFALSSNQLGKMDYVTTYTAS